MSLGKTALTARMAARLGLSKANCEVMIEETLLEIGRALTSGEPVSLPGFGTFRLQQQAARVGEVDGKPYSTPAKTVVKFRASGKLADAVAVLDSD
jgi:DNA-binding protein HU-beta